MVVVSLMNTKILGVNATLSYLKATAKAIKDETERGMKESTLHMVSEVKQSIAGRKAEPRSVKYGVFLNSVDYTVTPTKGVVFSNVKYAPYLEYGTTRVTPRRHFRNSLSRNRKKINEILQKRIGKATRLKGSSKLFSI